MFDYGIKLIGIFTQVSIRHPTLCLVQYDVTFLYIHLQVNITVKTSLQNGDQPPFCTNYGQRNKQNLSNLCENTKTIIC